MIPYILNSQEPNDRYPYVVFDEYGLFAEYQTMEEAQDAIRFLMADRHAEEAEETKRLLGYAEEAGE